MFLHDWSETKLAGMMEDFNITPEDIEGCEILLASYNYEDYSGAAFVLFRRDGKLYEVNGSHCSCFGLESQSYRSKDDATQWQPEETTKEALMMRINEGSLGRDKYAENGDFRDELLTVLGDL